MSPSSCRFIYPHDRGHTGYYETSIHRTRLHGMVSQKLVYEYTRTDHKAARASFLQKWYSGGLHAHKTDLERHVKRLSKERRLIAK